MRKKFTPKQKTFADEYIKNGGNATQAYIKAGYSENGANRSAQKLLTNTVVSGLTLITNSRSNGYRVSKIVEI